MGDVQPEYIRLRDLFQLEFTLQEDLLIIEYLDLYPVGWGDFVRIYLRKRAKRCVYLG